MKMRTLHDLFVDQLKDLYSAEHQIIKALPKMAKTASSPELRHAFEEHLEQTKEQAHRLEQIAQQLEFTPKGKKCRAIEGLIQEGKELMEENVEPEVMDAGLVAAGQKVEHYEIAAYGCARTWAEQMGHHEAVDFLSTTLDEEKETDRKLTHLAESMINRQAMGGEEHGDEEPELAGVGAEHSEGSSGRHMESFE